MKTIIIGYGSLGKIYASSLLKYEIIREDELYILKRSIDSHEKNQGNVFTEKIIPSIQADVILLSVKPQDFKTVVEITRKLLHKDTLIISVMAGITIEQLSYTLGHNKIIRAMPNSPIEIGMGITGFTAAQGLHFNDIKNAENILATTGRTIYFELEEQLNAVTALSGSGPAYFFYILKHMIEAGKQMGFSESVATTLVKQTMLGSFHLFNHSGKSADELIRTVASKGGTTFSAFETFEQYKIDEGLIKGIQQAEKRAKELSEITGV